MTADQQYPLYCQRGPYENPYENFVFSLTNRYPELRHLSSFLQHNTDTGLGRMTVLNFFSSGQVSDNKITHPKELQCLIRGCDTDGIVGHILLVEDLTRVSIEILGQRFGVDPRFFAHHLREPRKGLGGGSRMSSSLPRMLPSDARRAPHFMIEYEQSLNFGGSSQEFPKRLRCQSNVLRKVGLTKVASSNEFVGTARRCFSVLKVPREHVRWLCKSPNIHS
jgi:hypothetical protein